ncbi:hypothetical protein TNCV_4305491 [Trichonephila clavipes]|nr:hypothetical protein TNCV_4305491 [Trichonephila clavipes]
MFGKQGLPETEKQGKESMRQKSSGDTGVEVQSPPFSISLVYADKPQTLDHLEDNIRRVIADIRPQMLEKVIENWTSRLDYIRASRGSPTPGIIFKIDSFSLVEELLLDLIRRQGVRLSFENFVKRNFDHLII